MESVPSHQRITVPALPSIQYLPVSLFGAVMSIAGLALAWRLASKTLGAHIAVSNTIGASALALFVVLTLAYLAKLVRHPGVVQGEFLHPVTGNFFGTVGISILLLSSVIGAWSGAAQLVVWTIGAVFTLALGGVVIARLLGGNVAPAHVVPAWLIAGVGSLDIVVTSGALAPSWTQEVNLLAAIGGVSAIVFFVMIFGRMVHEAPLVQAMRPSEMILVAPFGVGFLAYVNLVHAVDRFAALLFYFGLFLFVIVGCRLVVKPAPFGPAWWAIGFPMAALASAASMYASAAGGRVPGLIAVALLVTLTVTVAVLSVRTVHALYAGRLFTAAR